MILLIIHMNLHQTTSGSFNKNLTGVLLKINLILKMNKGLISIRFNSPSILTKLLFSTGLKLIFLCIEDKHNI